MGTPAPLRVEDFREGIALPPGLRAEDIVCAITRLQEDWAALDAVAREQTGTSFADFVTGDESAACSQLVSRRVVASLDKTSAYRRDTAQRFPDLRHATLSTPLEVKSNLYGRAVQGHNPEDGWFLSVRYLLSESGVPEVVEVRIGELRKDQIRRDGKREGSGRTETATLRLRDLAVWYRRPKVKRAARRDDVRLAA